MRIDDERKETIPQSNYQQQQQNLISVGTTARIGKLDCVLVLDII